MAQFSDEFRAEMLIELAKMKTKMEELFEQTKMGLNKVFDEVIYNFKKKTIEPEEFKSCEEFQDPVDVDASSDPIKSLGESDWSNNLQSKGVSSLIQEPSSENETIESLKFNCRECLGFDWYNFLGEQVFMKFQRKLKDIRGSQCMVERQSRLSSKEYSDNTKNWDPYGFRLLVMDKCIAPWTARIGGFTWHSSYEEAMWFFLEMNGEYERRFNSETFVSLDFTCAGMEFPYFFKQLHAQLIVVGLGYGNYNGWLSKGLIDMYSITIDNIMYPIALHALVSVNGSCKSSNDNRVLGSQLATVYVAFGYSYDAFVVFDKLPQGSNLAWNGILKGFIDACTELNYFEDCKKIWDLFWWNDRHDDMKYNVYVEGAMIDMFAKCGSLSEARQFFGVKEKGSACWSEMICGNVQREETFESFSIFKRMRFKGLRLDSVLMSTILLACGRLKFMKFGRILQECAISMENKDDVFWSTLTTGYSQNCQYQENCQLYLVRKDAEIRANVIVAVSVLLVLSRLNLLKHGNELYDYILKKGFEYDGVVGAAMIEMFVNCKSMTEAKYIFRIMSDMDGTLWNLIFVGYSLNGEVDIAFQIFQTIWDFNLRSNSIIMVNSFPSCIKVGTLKYGKEIHAYEIRNGLRRTIFVGNSLLDMHCKCGTLKLGESIFNSTVDVTIVDCEEISQGVLMNQRSYKYVWVLEELKLEHERGATFDFALCMFETINCYCTIINASGHGDLIKNMIIGASHSQVGCATLIIDSITSGFETSVLKLGMVVNLGSSRLTIDVKSIEIHHAILQEALLGDNFGFNVENTFVKDLKRELVASNSKDDHAKEATNFTFQDIIMNHLGRIVPFAFYCYISHIVVKLAEVLTKIDRCFDKSLRKRPLLLDGVSGMFVRLLGCKNCIHP